TAARRLTARPTQVPTRPRKARAGWGLILFGDRGRRCDDGAVVVGDHEIAVGDGGRTNIRAHADVHAVTVRPERPDLDVVQPPRLAERQQHVFADFRVQHLIIVVFPAP